VPFANVRLYVLDEQLDPVPPGAVGEVCVGGLAVARGYRARPGLTAERFLPDPYATTAGARLYRTGDLVRRRLSGDLQFVGRIDHQVKIRGHRVELGEVEAALRRSPEVAEALVLAEPGPSGRRQLVAYVLPTDPSGAPEMAARLRRALRDRLPDHMVPSRLDVVPAFPLTVNGKVDVSTLRALAGLSRATLEDLLAAAEATTATAADAAGGGHP
jgi:acyl-coenzyme A synthetase/AMP-(fatty) acid ligase